MTSRSYVLEFAGYWRGLNISGLPAISGVYCVYACTYDGREKRVSLRKVLYIGEAADVRARVTNHERWDDWRRELYAGEELCFSAAVISPQGDREQAEAAMVHAHKPPLNFEYVQTFPYDATTVTTSGQNALLKAHFTVYPTGLLGQMTGGLGRRW